MIWVGGQVIPDDALTIPASDRTFEHGLGLFETLRTWEGRAPLLSWHKARMLRSAEQLGISIEPSRLPGTGDVARLLEAEGIGGDRMLRITATGGSGSSPSVVWMRTAELPPPTPDQGASLLLDVWPIPATDELARHKTLNYWSRRRASEQARRRGFDEALSRVEVESGRHWYYEGSRTNLFFVADWRFGSSPLGISRPKLFTPWEAGPIVPGIMRRLVLDLASTLRIAIEEVDGIDDECLLGRGEVFLTNSVRGIIPVGRGVVGGLEYTWPAPGRWTQKLQGLLADRLRIDRGTDS